MTKTERALMSALMSALEPFAKAADAIEVRYAPVFRGPIDDEFSVNPGIVLGDLRRARTALALPEAQPPMRDLQRLGQEWEAGLLPCPFCGGAGRLFSVSFPLGADCTDIQVSCANCDAIGPSVLFDQTEHAESNLPELEAEASAAWNTRTTLPEAPEVGREPHVFLDCDGVLADFDTYAEAYFGMPPRAYEAQVGSSRFWSELEAKGDFYRNLPLMPDAMALFEAVKHLHPTILTGCPRGDWAQGQKVAWAAEHFPGVPIITCRSADKRDYAKPGDVLIDDWAQHRHRWIEMGGVFITHHDAESSIAALFAHYPQLALIRPQTTEAGE
ncbi:Lar family restriction alleviation protein [Sphingomonas immobilis]|uniref:Lar family restriction alleviation protein n=1 Tax=Sphingomonas immobilis TaxID=3063997 RepID=A0ABT8ZU76_9SPHN|nr:Lar family restriction alleviation protein [Sphingomonas sp. CA1-15]MDO7841118.1 Lar family restriction alleviation protein [Sphingomonas sp. CA1-15]